MRPIMLSLIQSSMKIKTLRPCSASRNFYGNNGNRFIVPQHLINVSIFICKFVNRRSISSSSLVTQCKLLIMQYLLKHWHI